MPYRTRSTGADCYGTKVKEVSGMEQVMRSVGIKMSILMGLTMSFFLSLAGTFFGTMRAGRPFPPVGWLISFFVSLIVSLIIGFAVPMGRISRSIGEKMGKGTLKARVVDALVSDLIYTPVITLVMVFLNYRQAVAQGSQAPFIAMFLPSLILCFAVGFILIFVFQPMFMKQLMKGIGPGGPMGPGGPVSQ